MKQITLFIALVFSTFVFAQQALITGYVDSPCPSANGRVLEIYVDGTIDFTGWTVQRQSNGNGFTTNIDLSSFATISDAFIYITNNEATFTGEFGISTNILENSNINSNGDDAFQIIDNNSIVIDRFGEDGVDGTGTAWEHEDSYYLRNNFLSANAGSFDTSNWTFGALQVLDGQGLCNSSAALSTIIALGSFQPEVSSASDLTITEIFSGQEGTDLTADWFEIENVGTGAWVSGVDGDLYYDDESADPTTADIIQGISEIQPGGFAIVLIGDANDVTTFTNVWGQVIDLTDVQVGFTDGAGLGAGGDAVTIWQGDPNTTSPVDSATYPDTGANDGQSYDVDLATFSVVGNANGAVETIDMGGDNMDVPNIGSPGNGLPVSVTSVQFDAPYASVSEDGNSITITVEVSQAPTVSGSVEVSLIDGGTAVEGTDFSFAASETLNFAAGSTTSQSVTIPIINNTEDGSDLFFVLSLTNPSSVVIGNTNLFSVYILDDDTLVPTGNASELDVNYLTSYLVDAGGTAEITAYDSATQRLFVTTVGAIEVLDFSDPENITSLATVDITAFGSSVQSIAVSNGIVAAAISANDPLDNGFVVLADTDGNNSTVLEVGSLPDMLTFSPDGTKLLVANEGQPSDDYTVDPEGSVSVIDVTAGLGAITQADVTTLNFNAFNSQEAALKAAGVRIFGPGASVSQDLEPEYITVSDDSQMAYVTLQENNAYAVIDLSALEITDIISFGKKDHSLPQNSLDTSDETDFIFNASWPIKGLYMPDAVSFYSVNGVDYIVTANEGDARDYSGYAEEKKLGDSDYILDPNVFSNIEILGLETNLGDINVTAASGDENNDGLYEEIHVFGGRSFSIFEAATGNLVYDSGNDFEVITAADPNLGGIFNASNDNNNFKNRSDNKGPEPEGIIVKQIGDQFYAFVLLERIGGMMVYNITDPVNPVYLQYVNSRGTVPGEPESGDLGPEGVVYVDAADSPTGNALVILSNEVSATLSIYSLDNVLSVPENELTATTFKIYPNPAQGMVFFNKPDFYEIYDMLGRSVRSQKEMSSLDISAFAPGTYIVKNAEGISQKLIVK